MKLWVDDIRPAPDDTWHVALDSAAAMRNLKHRVVVEMSLDHDLGGDDTTRRVVMFLCLHPDLWPDVVHVHSANPVGVEWLTGMIDRYQPRDKNNV